MPPLAAKVMIGNFRVSFTDENGFGSRFQKIAGVKHNASLVWD